MKRFFSISLLMMMVMVCHAQFSKENSIMIKALVYFQKDDKGFYTKKTDQYVSAVNDAQDIYAYDKKNQKLYATNEFGNFEITATQAYAKELKKSKAIPKIKVEDLQSLITLHTESLEQKYQQINVRRKKEIEDSLERDQFIKDSLKQDAEKKARKLHEEKLEAYRNNHRWTYVKIGEGRQYCSISDCSHSISGPDSIFCIALKNDTIYELTKEYGDLGIDYLVAHKYPITKQMRDYEPFALHLEAFADSLKEDKLKVAEDIELWNGVHKLLLEEKIIKKAPYGYFEEWSWENDFSMSFNFTYVNTNKKTIKYIQVFFQVTNDVGDVRKTGSFTGTGPLPYGGSAEWNWDTSSYYLAGDASSCKLTKVIITYMDKSTKVLSEKMIYDNEDY